MISENITHLAGKKGLDLHLDEFAKHLQLLTSFPMQCLHICIVLPMMYFHHCIVILCPLELF